MNPKTDDTNVKTKNWQINDWCFHNFELYMVTKVLPRPGGIILVKSLSNGVFEKEDAYDFSKVIFPLDLEGKYICDTFKKAYDRFLLETTSVKENINDVGIFQWFNQKWIECMRNRHSQPEKSHFILKEMNDFVEEVSEVVTKNQTVKGVKIFL